jgi:DNA-binding transcriptional LysR family regulator
MLPRMTRPDLNLLFTLDALLSEGSVARAAVRLGLSPSAMSRSLARLRTETGDPLLVRAGRGLVPTPRALQLRSQIGPLVDAAEAALRPVALLDVSQLDRTFTLRASEGFVENFGAALLTRVAAEAPRVRLRFVARPRSGSGSGDVALRDAGVDLDIGVVGPATGPEVRTQALFRDRFVGVVGAGHPLSGRGRVTLARYAAARHVSVARRASAGFGPVDEALAAAGVERDITVVVGGFGAALALARGAELVATVPERHTGCLREGLVTFALPFAVAEVTVAMMWHPRLEADGGQGWLRGCVREVCGVGGRVRGSTEK